MDDAEIDSWFLPVDDSQNDFWSVEENQRFFRERDEDTRINADPANQWALERIQAIENEIHMTDVLVV